MRISRNTTVKKLIFGGFEPPYLKKPHRDRVGFLVCCSGHHYQTCLPGRPFVAPKLPRLKTFFNELIFRSYQMTTTRNCQDLSLSSTPFSLLRNSHHFKFFLTVPQRLPYIQKKNNKLMSPINTSSSLNIPSHGCHASFLAKRFTFFGNISKIIHKFLSLEGAGAGGLRGGMSTLKILVILSERRAGGGGMNTALEP